MGKRTIGRLYEEKKPKIWEGSKRVKKYHFKKGLPTFIKACVSKER